MRITVKDQPCGYKTEICVEKVDKRSVRVKVKSECPDVQRYGERLGILDAKDILTKIPENNVYRLADIRHSTCVIPYMILKAAEIELGLNVKKFFSYQIDESC